MQGEESVINTPFVFLHCCDDDSRAMSDQLTVRASIRAGAGFRSKSMYGSGFFHMRMKLPSGYTAGVVTTFYVS